MRQYPYWETAYQYFRNQGIPHNVLTLFCISSAEAEQIGTIIEKTRPRTILEIGTFIGLSTCVIALASLPESKLVCVDPNLPVRVLTDQLGYQEPRNSLELVRSMLAHFQQEQKATVLEGYFSHLSAAKCQQISALGDAYAQAPIIGEDIGQYGPYDLVFLDGDHHTDAVASDLNLLARYLSRNGILVLHDVSKAWGEHVRNGIASFTQEHTGFSLSTDHNLGFLSRDTEKAWLVPQREPSRVWRAIRKAKKALLPQ